MGALAFWPTPISLSASLPSIEFGLQDRDGGGRNPLDRADGRTTKTKVRVSIKRAPIPYSFNSIPLVSFDLLRTHAVVLVIDSGVSLSASLVVVESR